MAAYYKILKIVKSVKRDEFTHELMNEIEQEIVATHLSSTDEALDKAMELIDKDYNDMLVADKSRKRQEHDEAIDALTSGLETTFDNLDDGSEITYLLKIGIDK